jgi:pyruvate,water dikinase
VLRALRSLLSKRKDTGASDLSAEALRDDFRARYHDFKLLITANNRALEVMNDIEQALAGTGTFGMAFVRSRCTAATVNVLQMLIRMNGLSKGKYDPLFARFEDIKRRIDGIIEESETEDPGATETPALVIPLNQLSAADTDAVGGKMAQIGEIAGRLQLPVPGGFAISTAAYRRFMVHNALPEEIDRRLQKLRPGDLREMQITCAAIQQRIVSAEMPPELSEAIGGAYRRLADARPGLRVAMRSSALGEDMQDQSFAGLYTSRLNVPGDELDAAYKEIVASKYGLSAVAYRLKRGLRDEDIAMGVGCLEMVDASAGGVMYSRHPVDPAADTVYINAVPGLPKAVVDGTGGFDEIEVSRSAPHDVAKEAIRRKTQQFLCDPHEGVCRIEPVSEDADKPAITRETACRLAELALRLEDHNGTPQDIEWAVDKAGRLFLLAEPAHGYRHHRQRRFIHRRRCHATRTAVGWRRHRLPGRRCRSGFRLEKVGRLAADAGRGGAGDAAGAAHVVAAGQPRRGAGDGGRRRGRPFGPHRTGIRRAGHFRSPGGHGCPGK